MKFPGHRGLEIKFPGREGKCPYCTAGEDYSASVVASTAYGKQHMASLPHAVEATPGRASELKVDAAFLRAGLETKFRECSKSSLLGAREGSK